MVNSKGIVQNNDGVTKFLRDLKNDPKQYPVLSREKERSMIDEYMARGEEDELRKLLVMHNMRMVFNCAKHYCKSTVDYDNMIAKAAYGLVFAANRFNLYEKICDTHTEDMKTVVDGEEMTVIDWNTCKPKQVEVKIPRTDSKGNVLYVRFCTYAHNWIMKYVREEFDMCKNFVKVDNNTSSMDAYVRIKNSDDSRQTLENYLEDKISPDYSRQKDIISVISSNEAEDFYKNIHKYIEETNELTSVEKQIIIDSFYNRKKINDISNELMMKPQSVMQKKVKALGKLKDYITSHYNVDNINDLIEN